MSKRRKNSGSQKDRTTSALNVEKKERPQDRWDRLNTRVYRIKVMTQTEQDIIAKLDSVPNKAGYIKSLIREDIARSK